MYYLRWGLRSLRSSSKFFFGHNNENLLLPAHYGALVGAKPPFLHSKVMGCTEPSSWGSRGLHDIRYRVEDSSYQESVDPFSLVADELSNLANRLRSMVVSEVPKLASAAEYFFKMGVEGKRFRPTVLLLMASAMDVPIPVRAIDGEIRILPNEVRARQQSIAEITEMIHVASLLHDDVLDDAETRRGIGSLNFVMGNKATIGT